MQGGEGKLLPVFSLYNNIKNLTIVAETDSKVGNMVALLLSLQVNNM